MAPFEKSCYKKIQAHISNGWKVMAKVKVFVITTNANTYTDTRAYIQGPWTFVLSHK